ARDLRAAIGGEDLRGLQLPRSQEPADDRLAHGAAAEHRQRFRLAEHEPGTIAQEAAGRSGPAEPLPAANIATDHPNQTRRRRSWQPRPGRSTRPTPTSPSPFATW